MSNYHDYDSRAADYKPERSKIDTSGDDFQKICIEAHDRLGVGVMLMRIAGSWETFLKGKQRCHEALEMLEKIKEI